MSKLGSVQQAIMQQLGATPIRPHGGVADMRVVTRTLNERHLPNAVSRAAHQLVRRGVLESMTRTGAHEFRPDNGWESQLRFVRRSGR